MSVGEDILDMFEAGISSVFNEPMFAHGSPGALFTHEFSTRRESLFGFKSAVITSSNNSTKNYTINLIVPKPEADSSAPLMAHHVWQAALVLSREIANGNIDVSGSDVFEFGAGVGLCSFVAAACGASSIVATDFPDPGIINQLIENCDKILGPEFRHPHPKPFWNVVGHTWGNSESLALLKDNLDMRVKKPVIVLMADLLWIPTAHMDLLADVHSILSHGCSRERGVQSKAVVTAGLHTSRETIDAFFAKARRHFGFQIRKIGEVKVTAIGLEHGFQHIEEDVSDARRELERDGEVEIVDVEVEITADVNLAGAMTVEDALQEVLKKALIHDGLARGLRESVKALDRRQAHLCVYVETNTEKEYIKLVEALCAEHNINVIKVADAKKLGEWVGLCKIDANGEARKVVGCSCVVVKDFGEDSEARSILLSSFSR
ncbi:hypothetical protein HK100_004716 [Physocladia obscura]|uniref:40S ribosomal protein S12 n=1 Tax=Physocladia obscura TaxID=109957 RepID=A0AAD5STI4_9FUNG|nr:hypothetical protein HK100_004716 [Physocladia obscura]